MSIDTTGAVQPRWPQALSGARLSKRINHIQYRRSSKEILPRVVHRDDPRKEVARGGHHRGELYQHRIRYGQSIVIYRNWSEQSGQTRGSRHTQVSQKCFKLHFDDMTAINCIHITYLERFSDKFPPKALVLSLAASNYFFSLEVSYRTTHS